MRSSSAPVTRSIFRRGVDPPNVLGLEQSEAPEAEDCRLEHSFGSRSMNEGRIGQRGLQTGSCVGEEPLDQSRTVEA